MKWKTARIIPLSKGHGTDISSPAGYRPIAMLPVISKICERVVQQQIARHMKSNKLWNQNGHAYKEDHSTTTALLQLSDLIYMGGGTEMKLGQTLLLTRVLRLIRFDTTFY